MYKNRIPTFSQLECILYLVIKCFEVCPITHVYFIYLTLNTLFKESVSCLNYHQTNRPLSDKLNKYNEIKKEILSSKKTICFQIKVWFTHYFQKLCQGSNTLYPDHVPSWAYYLNKSRLQLFWQLWKAWYGSRYYCTTNAGWK